MVCLLLSQTLSVAQRRTFLEWSPVNNREYLKKWTDNTTLTDWVLDRMKLLEVYPRCFAGVLFVTSHGLTI
jgi:hypothetical protein